MADTDITTKPPINTPVVSPTSVEINVVEKSAIISNANPSPNNVTTPSAPLNTTPQPNIPEVPVPSPVAAAGGSVPAATQNQQEPGYLKKLLTGIKRSSTSAPGAIIVVAQVVWAIITIAAVIMVIYILYRVFKYGYIRPFSMGHSEQFDLYMESYMKDFIEISKYVIDSNDDNQTKSAIEQFFKAYENLSDGVNPLQIKLENYKPNSLPYIYLIIIFYESIKDKDEHELTLMPKFVDRKIVEQFYIKRKDIEESQTINLPSIEKLESLRQAFDNIRLSVKNDVKTIKENGASLTENDPNLSIKLYTLDLMVNKYFDKNSVDNDNNTSKDNESIDNIVRSYNLRKTGGRSKILFHMYTKEYSQYIFKEYLPDLWKPYGDEVKLLAKLYQDFIASDTVRDVVLGLPMVLAGVNKEDFVDMGVSTGPNGEVQEHFIGVLKSIAKTFVALYTIVVAIAQIVADPANIIPGILQWLIGIIIGFLIYIMYLILLVMSFVFIIPAAIIIFILKTAITILWVVIYVLIIVIVGVLTLIDMFTGGIVLTLLRCENLPNAWHMLPGFVRDNVYVRKFFCQMRCTSRYHPSGYGCKKLPDYEPAYCPQQLIFNAYNTRLDQLKSVPYIHQYQPTIDYYLNKTEEERKTLWENLFDQRRDFMELCSDKMKPYDHITNKMCHIMTKDNDFKEKNREQYDQIMALCDLTYCTSPEDQALFCNSNAKTDNDKKDFDIITSITMKIIILVLAVIFASQCLNLVTVNV